MKSTNMACALKGELKCKDGRTSTFTVEAENSLKSIIAGVKKINSEISVVLTELVEEEKRLSAERGERRAHGELTTEGAGRAREIFTSHRRTRNKRRWFIRHHSYVVTKPDSRQPFLLRGTDFFTSGSRGGGGVITSVTSVTQVKFLT